MTNYKSNIILGEYYIDKQTGYEGIAIAIYFYQHACERVDLEIYDRATKKVIQTIFDAPRLTHMKTNVKAVSDKTGGPARFGEGDRGSHGDRS